MGYRRHLRRALAAIGVGTLIAVAPVAPASAEPPTNDDMSGATVFTLPYRDGQVTVEATTSAEESAFAGLCGSPVERGVWFTTTATESTSLVVDALDSTYGAGVLVASGHPGSLVPLACSSQGFLPEVPVSAGQAIYILVFDNDDIVDSFPILALSVFHPVPLPEISMTLDRRGTVNRTGVAQISGTVTCTFDGPQWMLTEVTGNAGQRKPDPVAFFFLEPLPRPCDGVTQTWTAEVSGERRITAGKLRVAAFALACTTDPSCVNGFVEGTVQLRRSPT